MDGINLLKEEARAKRDKLIQYARNEYRLAIREIRTVERKLYSADSRRRVRLFKQFNTVGDDSLQSATAIQAAEVVLREGKPLTLVELTIEVMTRGCRANDDPKVVANALRGSLSYHKGRFSRDGEGRWIVLGTGDS